MTALSDLLHSRLPDGWTPERVAIEIGKLPTAGKPVHKATVHAYFNGKHAKDPRENVLRALSTVLNIPVGDLRVAADVPRGEEEPWEPPEQSGRLSNRQRKALDELIRSFTDPAAAAGAKIIPLPTFPDPNKFDNLAADEQEEEGGQPETFN